MNGLSTIKMAAVSGLPAALSVLKGYMASVMPIGDASASVIATKPPAAEHDSGMYD